MTVYVDEYRDNGQSATWKYPGNCHMVADSLEELYAMADRLGLKRTWLQQKRADDLPHFDLTLSKRRLAVKFGAVEIGPMEMWELVKAYRRAERTA